MSGKTGWFDVGAVIDIPALGARRVNTPEGTIAVFRNAYNEVFAVEDVCPHRGGPLSQGIVHDCSVTCPLHNLVIDLRTGLARGEDAGKVATVPVEVREGRIFLRLRLDRMRAA